MAFLFLREPRYVAEATFRQTPKQNEIGLSLKDAYQQFLSFTAESAAAAIMQSNEVLKDVIENLGMQADCDPDFIVVKAVKRIRDNFLLELGCSIADPDLFTFRNVSYAEEKPLQLFLKLTNENCYQLFDQNKQLIGEGKLREPVSISHAQFTLHRIPKSAQFNRWYFLTIHPWLPTVEKVRKKIKIAPWKQDKTILKLLYPSRDRFLAADFLNQVMKSYQKYLKRESDETYQAQLAYLLQRQQELTQTYDEALIDHVRYLKDNIHKNGFVGVAQEIEILSQPKNFYTSKLFDVDLELQRLYAKKELLTASKGEQRYLQTPQRVKNFEQKKLKENVSLYTEKKYIENRIENSDLDQKRNEEALLQPLRIEIDEVNEQLREAKLLLEHVEKQEKIPAFPSLLKEPRSAIALLVKQIADSQASIDETKENPATIIAYIHEFIDHLSQKCKILKENLNLQQQESNDFSGLNLTTAQELLGGYTRERDNLQAQLRELVFLRDQLSDTDFEVSSLGGVFNDSITADLIHKASALALQLKDDSNRSLREQARLVEALQTQKDFLSQYLLQTIELKKLRTKLLSDKILSLCRTNVSLLQSEKKLLKDKLHELNVKMSDLPEQWRRESLLILKKELGTMMLQGVSQLAETKNLGQHIFQASCKPLDAAIPPTRIGAPKILIFSLFSSILAAICFYAVIFCKKMLKGFPVTEENLKVSGFPICGSLSRYCNVNLSELQSKDLETLRRIAEFLVSDPKKSEAFVVSCIGGKYPNYAMSLAEILSMRGLKILVVNCIFDQVVHSDDMPGLWQYLNSPPMDLPFKRNSMFDYLPSGGTTRHAAELVGSAKFSNFLSRVKQKYDIVLLFSSADASTAEGHAFLPISDSIIVAVQQEQKKELVVYVDWAEKKGTNCATFVYIDETASFG
jgi:tyrosine-protein kinase Etk/Wzc